MDRTPDAVESAYFAGRLAWPEVEGLSLQDFVDHACSLQVSEVDLVRRGAELYLALACGKSNQVALAILKANHFAAIDAYLGRTGFDSATRQDVVQDALLHLCAGASPRILTYAARASLGSWLRVAAYRFAVQGGLRRNSAVQRENEFGLKQLMTGELDPETSIIIEKARPLFQDALQRTLSDLSIRDKTLLRLAFLDGLSIDAIGAVYQVHRATAARWISDVRKRILATVEETLIHEFGLHPSELDSLAFLVQSELHLSLSRVLGAA